MNTAPQEIQATGPQEKAGTVATNMHTKGGGPFHQKPARVTLPRLNYVGNHGHLTHHCCGVENSAWPVGAGGNVELSSSILLQMQHSTA